MQFMQNLQNVRLQCNIWRYIAYIVLQFCKTHSKRSFCKNALKLMQMR